MHSPDLRPSPSHRRLAGAALSMTLAAAAGPGCAADGPSQPPAAAGPTATSGAAASRAPEAAPRRDGPFRVGTFNAGLAVGVLDHAEARAEPVAQRLAEQPLELLCVQEFWLEDHWRKLVDAAAGRLPHTHRHAPDPGGAVRCAAEEVQPIAACAARHCAAAGAESGALCMLQHCAGVIQQASGGCLSCLGQDPTRPLRDIVSSCVGGAAPAQPAAPGAKSARGRGQQGAAGFYGYGGSYGTGILSNAPLLERDALTFPSSLTRRGVLYAKVDAPFGAIHAFCTHLTADLGPRHPAGGSWAKDQKREIDALLSYIEAKAGDGPAVVLGDLNTGPAIAPHISARLPAHYQELLSFGLRNPYSGAGAPRCTYCFDNPLQGGAGTYGSLIDHVLVRGVGGVPRGDLLRAPLHLDVGGRRVRTGFSDHYGVVVELLPAGS